MSGKTNLFLILPLLILVIGFTSNAYGQIVNPITVTTDKSLYYEGETIVISGEVSEILYGYAVSLVITGPNGDVILIDQLIVDQNKKFQTEITAGGQLMNETGSGTYTVSVLYATANRTDETTFQYISSNTEQDVSDFGALGSEHSHAGILVKIFGDEFDFSTPAYQIKSSWIHFESNDSTTIHKHATGVTLGYLFDTLGLGLDDQCYVFLDGRSFCTNEDYSLKFFINGKSVNGIRDYVISDGDQILISYGVDTGTVIFRDPRITDSGQNYLSIIKIGKQYDITATIINQRGAQLEFFKYQNIVSRQDDGDTVSIAWITGSLMQSESYSPSLSWIPEEAGAYDIKFHLFDTIESNNKLAPSLSLSVTVIESSLPEASIDAATNKSFYDYGDMVFVNGKIKNYDANVHSNLAVTYRVYDPEGNDVTIGQTSPNFYGSFSFNFVAGGNLFELSGKYPIQLVFGSAKNEIPMYFSGGEPGVPLDVTPPKILQPKDIEVDLEPTDTVTSVIFDVLVIDDTDKIIQPTCKPRSGYLFGIGDTKVTCTARDSAGNYAIPVSFTVTVNPPGFSIPSWVKEVAEFWCEDKIEDGAFVEGIQYLIDNGIIVVPSTSVSYSGSQEVPQWVKNNACWWSAGLITDKDFASGIEYLVKQGIIQV